MTIPITRLYTQEGHHTKPASIDNWKRQATPNSLQNYCSDVKTKYLLRGDY